MSFKHPRIMGAEVCEAFGIEPKNVRTITLQFTVNALPTVVVESVVRDADELVPVLRRFTLTEKVEEQAS